MALNQYDWYLYKKTFGHAERHQGLCMIGNMAFSQSCEDSEKVATCNQGERPQRNQTCQHLDL